MNEKLNIVICDDEKTWLEEASRILRNHANSSGLELCIEAYASGTEMLRDVRLAPDLLFCDIELSDGGVNGIDLVGMVNHIWPTCQMVYVTNFLRYAPDVYVTEHLWFVLKEQFEERLPEIFTKMQRQRNEKKAVLAVTATNKEMLSIPCEDILCFERGGRTTTITMRDGTYRVVPDRLPDLLERLSSRSFAQCHGSYVVNLAHVHVVGKDSIILTGGVTVPLSRRQSRSFRNRYLDWVDDYAV